MNNPDDHEEPCSICHQFADSCICPECDVCGEAGNPDCINTHMPWSKWGHFKFQIEIAHQRKKDEALLAQQAAMFSVWRRN